MISFLDKFNSQLKLQLAKLGSFYIGKKEQKETKSQGDLTSLSWQHVGIIFNKFSRIYVETLSIYPYSLDKLALIISITKTFK